MKKKRKLKKLVITTWVLVIIIAITLSVLKSVGAITTPWWLIWAPLWLPAVLFLAFAAFTFIYTAIKMRNNNEDLYKW